MMPDSWDFLLIALASWRLAVLLIRERGPWDISLRLRSCVGIEHDEDGDPISFPTTMPGTVFACIWCMSVWTSLLMLALWLSGPGVVVVLLFGIAGAAVLVELSADKLQR